MKVKATEVRYIKLGPGGRWQDVALERGELHFGYGKAGHELALKGNLVRLKDHLVGLGRGAQAAARDAQEILDFYQLGTECLWITFARDHLWWAFAAPEVTWLGGEGKVHGERIRKVIGGWRNTDINGDPLRTDMLSTRLTKVAGYRRTICKVEAQDYLLRRINGVEEPIVRKGTRARKALVDVIERAISCLHWRDFETLIDIIFARSGWSRVSALGGTQKTVDLELEQVTTSERAAVQVKSVASQKTLNRYVQRVDEAERFDRFFFICHSVKGHLKPPADRHDVHVWTGEALADSVIRAGLQDWVLEKVA